MRLIPLMATAVLVLAGCGDNTAEAPAEAAPPAEAAAGAPAAVPTTFDLSKVPVSTAPLGAFPYVTATSGYLVRDEETLDLASYPLWNGAAFQNVEGRTHMASSGTPEGKTYSRVEFERGLQQAVEALGGVRIASGVAPNAAIETIPETQRSEVYQGLGPIWGSPITSYVIRRADRTIWIQVVSDESISHWAVVDGPAYAPPPAG